MTLAFTLKEKGSTYSVLTNSFFIKTICQNTQRNLKRN